MHQIRRLFEQKDKLSDTDWAYFSARLVRAAYPKKHLILKAGEVENTLSFIEKGLVRFYIPQAEKDLTFGFAFEGNFVSGYDSFLTRQPSHYAIETLAPSVVWHLTHQDLEDIYSNTAIGNTIGRHAAEDLFLKKSNREISLLTQTAQQRYESLFTEQPHLIQQIPLKYIASYIGVTPQALSRIRKRIT